MEERRIPKHDNQRTDPESVRRTKERKGRKDVQRASLSPPIFLLSSSLSRAEEARDGRCAKYVKLRFLELPNQERGLEQAEQKGGVEMPAPAVGWGEGDGEEGKERTRSVSVKEGNGGGEGKKALRVQGAE